MKKIGLLVREKIIEELKERVSNAEGCFFIGFNKIEASSFSDLRNNLKPLGAYVFITKNSLFKRALEELKWKEINNFFEGETGVVLINDKDVATPCKILVDFAKETEILKLKGGVIKEKSLSPKEMVTLAMLPPKDILLSMVVSSLASPLTGFLSSLNQIILKFVWVIEEIKKKKG